MEYGESTECPYTKMPQKTGTEHQYLLEDRVPGQIVDQKCSVLFLFFFLAVLCPTRLSRGESIIPTQRTENTNTDGGHSKYQAANSIKQP